MVSSDILNVQKQTLSCNFFFVANITLILGRSSFLHLLLDGILFKIQFFFCLALFGGTKGGWGVRNLNHFREL